MHIKVFSKYNTVLFMSFINLNANTVSLYKDLDYFCCSYFIHRNDFYILAGQN